jgi:predicted O-methyltransferase YrrM
MIITEDGNFTKAAESINYRYDHPKLIYAFLRCLGITRAIEIGCHIGYTSCWMAKAIQENGGGMLYCIDPFCWVEEPQEEAWNQSIDSCGVRDAVTLIKGRSQEVEWPSDIECVFVDGNHTYPVAKHDAEKARDMGARLIFLHDTVAWDGSRRHAEEIMDDPAWSGWDKMQVNSECGITVLLKQSQKPASWGEDSGEQWDKPTES